ncbi:Fibroblast growth factor 19 [Plecturocebus cupreus]
MLGCLGHLRGPRKALYKAARPGLPRRRSRSAASRIEGHGHPNPALAAPQRIPVASLPPAPPSPELCRVLQGGAMRSGCVVVHAWILAGLWLAVAGRPLAFSDAGPHVHYGWGDPIRLRHLYTSGPHGLSSCFLRIRTDGVVDCARGQSAHSECPQGPRPRPAARIPPQRTSFATLGSPGPLNS